ncbi:hypothetical protein OKW96_06490 [Sphingobacterium sp. KU25419]|nr:hypothetical protein OKW96_06490 [Sphingobacterium sp. KU25419]
MITKEQDTEGRGKYFLAAFLGPLIWGFMAVPIRLLKNWSAEDILHYRIILAVSLLWLFNFIFRKRDLKKDYRNFQLLPKNKELKSFISRLHQLFYYLQIGTPISIASTVLAYKRVRSLIFYAH